MSSHLIDLGIILVLLGGISRFRTPPAARLGNLLTAAALGAAIAVIFARHSIGSIGLVLAAGAAGAATGATIAWRVSMIQIPAMVAIQNGMGGMAAFLISYAELIRQDDGGLSTTAEGSALLGLLTGAATFSGSLVAAGKLSSWMRQTPIRLRHHDRILTALCIFVPLLMLLTARSGEHATLPALGVLLPSAVLGAVFAIRVGGADMPVLISFLNAATGLAAAFCGIAVGSRLLAACGATVAASGFILTQAMCRGMNRGLTSVFTGIQPSPASGVQPEAASASTGSPVQEASSAEDHGEPADVFERALGALQSAAQIIIIPGYGMALADAQEEVVQLGDKLAAMGKEVRFAIHPVAGRMPGHMHVLLAEAEVDYSRIRELKDINSDFARTDVALVVGACDVVNPAAIETTGTPISGMPILRADEAGQVIVCNLDDRPGYSGVDNPLYSYPRTMMLLGDAKQSVGRLLEGLD